MPGREPVTLARDCEAIQIPDGYPVLLPKGYQLQITQTLGGTFTVAGEYGGLYRIDAKDADALGKEKPADAVEETDAGDLEQRVWHQLRQCYDPEIPVNVVDLGLIYDCPLDGTPEAGYGVGIKMTLTAPGCGMGDVLAQDVKKRIESLKGVREAQVEVVFDPPWNQNMMSDAAKLQLGFF